MKFWWPFCVSILLVFSCRKKPTTWDADYTLPVIKDTLDISDLRFDSLLTMDQNGNYKLALNEDLYDLSLASFVTIPDTFVQTEFSLNFSTNVPAGFEFINQTEENDLNLDPVLLKKVYVKEGSFDVEIENPHETTIFYTITFPDVISNGQVYSVQVSAPPGSISSPSIVNTSISLNNTQITLTGANGDESNILRTVFGVKSDPNGPDIVATPNHVTRFRTSLKNIVLDYARGYFGQQSVEDTFSIELDFLKKIKSGLINFPNTNLEMILVNGAKVTGKVNLLEVKSINKDGSTVSLTHPKIGQVQTVNASVGSYGSYTPYELSYLFTYLNSNLESFLENGLDRIFVRYSFEINPNGNISGSYDEAFSTSLLKLRLKADMPLNIGLNELTYEDTFTVNTANIQKELSRIQGAAFKVNGKNSFEVDAFLSFEFLDANKQILFSKPSAVHLPAGTGGAINTSGLAEKNFENLVNLTKEEIEKMKQCAYMVPSFKLSTYGVSAGTVSPTQLNIAQKLLLQIGLIGTYQNEID